MCPIPATSLLLLCGLAGCAAAPVPSAQSVPAAVPASASTMSPEGFRTHVAILASDAFEGRAPGGAGEERTIAYLRTQFQQLGLRPAFGDSYFQTVPMMQTTADESAVLRLDVDGTPRTLKFGTDMVIGTRSGKPQVSVRDSDVVFVGYGVNAPEQGWNDYAGVDVRGKTVLMLVNDPGFHAADAALFEGVRMTYYGRWTYKFDEAARQGAAAALIIHDTPGASYGWDVVRNSWSGAQFDLRAADDPAPRLPLQGWISADAAADLFAGLGMDLKALYAAAGRRGFKPMPLKARATVTLDSRIVEKSSRNVGALLPGSTRADEAVVYMAHWDHLGMHEGEPGDNIYNGAIDNATGIAGILEIAKASVVAPRPQRSLMFLAVTLEESGLLGSKYYVAHPSIPLNKTVAVINLDAMPVLGRSRDFTVVGLGNSELEDILKPIAQRQGRELRMEATPESGFYFRSDHFNFARSGVPALYAKGGSDLLEGGTATGIAALAEYTANRYHKPSDEYDPAWNLDGVMQDLEALYAVGREIADGDRWPEWYPGNAFRAAREASMREPGAH